MKKKRVEFFTPEAWKTKPKRWIAHVASCKSCGAQFKPPQNFYSKVYFYVMRVKSKLPASKSLNGNKASSS